MTGITNKTEHLFLTRDTAGSQLYCFWTTTAPKLNDDGYWQYRINENGKGCSVCILSVQPHLMPFRNWVTLEPGECMTLKMKVSSILTTNAVQPATKEDK
jgi:hypothetical protein